MEQHLTSLATAALHAGEPRPRPYGSLNVPIFQSSVFEYAGETDKPLRYPRYGNTPNHEVLAAKLAALEGGEDALVAATGMAAITAAILAALGRGGRLLVQRGTYGGTAAFVLRHLRELGLEFDFIDAGRPDAWASLVRPNTRAIYVETMSNPCVEVPDLAAVVLGGTNDLGWNVASPDILRNLTAMYEQGISPAYERTPLSGGTSLAIHESQSRMWENLVGRSLPFWEHFFPTLKKTFPSQLDGVSLKTFYKAINKVQPSLIRVNADEATYNLHIMLRLELEIAMVEESITLKDLPEIWNTKMQEYLGITPPDEAQGVLQDIHWSYGSVGYFSTYALGNLVSAQLWEKINKDVRTLDDQICSGEFSELLGWLRKNIHQFGRKYDPQDLVQKVTGSKIIPEPYVRYLTKKYNEIYGL